MVSAGATSAGVCGSVANLCFKLLYLSLYSWRNGYSICLPRQGTVDF